MVQYKLYYFDGRGIAEAIRLLFIYTKQPFEDIRFSHQDLAKWVEQEKSTFFPTNLATFSRNDAKITIEIYSEFFYGKLPVLEIDGKQQLAQSAAILRYLGEKCGLCGKDEWEKAKMNEIIDFHKDVQNTLSPYIYVKKGYKEGDLEKLREEFRTNAGNFFSLYVKLLKESGSGFLLPSGLSIADFMVIEYLDTLRKSEPEVVNKFPELIEYIGRVNSLPQLKEYVEKRTDPGW